MKSTLRCRATDFLSRLFCPLAFHFRTIMLTIKIRVPSLLTLAVASLWATGSPLAQAQSLVDLYESARAFDAGYLSARLQYDANLARADQTLATILPTAGLSAGATRTNFQTSLFPSYSRPFNTENAALSPSQPL